MSAGRWSLLGLAIGVLSCGGGGSGHVELSGKTPSEGAALAARAVCTRLAECGDVSIACTGGGAAGGSGSAAPPTYSCVANIRPVVYQDCFDDAGSDIAKLLACPALTPADVDMLELCFDALVARACVTQADADARARLLEMGGDPAPEEPPAECALLRTPPAGCGGAPPTR